MLREFRHLKAQFEVDANVIISVRDALTDAILEQYERRNMFVLSGRNVVRDYIANESPAGATHVAVGTGTTGAVDSDTTLQTEVFRGAVTKITKNSSFLDIFYYLPSTAANGSTLTEAGIFNASSGGSMFARAIYTGISKTSSIAVTYDWTLTIA